MGRAVRRYLSDAASAMAFAKLLETLANSDPSAMRAQAMRDKDVLEMLTTCINRNADNVELVQQCAAAIVAISGSSASGIRPILDNMYQMSCQVESEGMTTTNEVRAERPKRGSAAVPASHYCLLPINRQSTSSKRRQKPLAT